MTEIAGDKRKKFNVLVKAEIGNRKIEKSNKKRVDGKTNRQP